MVLSLNMLGSNITGSEIKLKASLEILTNNKISLEAKKFEEYKYKQTN